MFEKYFKWLFGKIANFVIAHPYGMLLITLVASIPAFYAVSSLTIDTNLIKLLPRTARASLATRELEKKVGDGGHFTVLYSGAARDKMIQAVNYSAGRIKKFEEVESVQYKWPNDFIRKYKYALIPRDYLNKLYDMSLEWEAKVNPMTSNLMDERDKPVKHGDEEDKQDMEVMVQRYMNLPDYHESTDHKVFGMFIPTNHGVTSLGMVKELHDKIEKVCREAKANYGVEYKIAGNHMNKINEYNMIMNDLNWSGYISYGLILIVLFWAFRTFPAVLVITLPMTLGLSWGFAIVPSTIGSLNLITSFLLMILFGMNVDYAIYMTKRFQQEYQTRPMDEALRIMLNQTGYTITVSGLTTALSFMVLVMSDMRGFSEFGIIGAISIITVLAAMFTVLPACIIIACRWGYLKKMHRKDDIYLKYHKWVTVATMTAVVAGTAWAVYDLKFDYVLSNTQENTAASREMEAARQLQNKVYSGSMGVASIYLAPGLTTLDSLLATFEKQKLKDSTYIGRVRSIRDFADSPEGYKEKLEILSDLKDQFSGSWVKRISDTSLKNMIADFLAWEAPPVAPSINDIPKTIKSSYLSRNNTGYYLVTVNPNVERKDGKNAIKFSKELYGMKLPSDVKGPIGETIVFAEVLNIVINEGWWISLFTLLGVFALVWMHTKNFAEACFIMVPLLSALGLSFGVMAMLGLKLNFYNMVILPTLLCMGVDGNVHYYDRWKELGCDIEATQKDSFESLTLAVLTNLLGYAGLLVADHSGLRSIGDFACIGLALIWVTNLFLLPGLIKIFYSKKIKAGKVAGAAGAAIAFMLIGAGTAKAAGSGNFEYFGNEETGTTFSSQDTGEAGKMKFKFIPYAFYNEELKWAFGSLVSIKGIAGGPEFLKFGGIAATNNTFYAYLQMEDFVVPGTKRLYFRPDIYVGRLGVVKLYKDVPGLTAFNPPAGSNYSDVESHINAEGADQWYEFSFRYLLPIGHGRDNTEFNPRLENGLLAGNAQGGTSWNPLESGRSFLELKPVYRKENLGIAANGKHVNLTLKTAGLSFGLFHDNMDYKYNPTNGSFRKISYFIDWGAFNSTSECRVAQIEYAKYINLRGSGRPPLVLALSFQTSDCPTWNDYDTEKVTLSDGRVMEKKIYHRPQYFAGSTLGGYERMRGFHQYRYSDRSMIYYGAELRDNLAWNPLNNWKVTRRLGVDWLQLVGFGEVGRVAPAWSIKELHKDMKWCAGGGLRAFLDGLVVRADVGVGSEGPLIQMFYDHPF